MPSHWSPAPPGPTPNRPCPSGACTVLRDAREPITRPASERMIPPRLIFSRLKRRVSIETLPAANGWLGSFQKRGDRLTGPCPLHGGDNPHAFVVSRSKNLWYCFTVCRAGGDVVELARRLLGLSYAETARCRTSLADGEPMRRT